MNYGLRKFATDLFHVKHPASGLTPRPRVAGVMDGDNPVLDHRTDQVPAGSWTTTKRLSISGPRSVSRETPRKEELVKFLITSSRQFIRHLSTSCAAGGPSTLQMRSRHVPPTYQWIERTIQDEGAKGDVRSWCRPLPPRTHHLWRKWEFVG